VSLLPGVPSQLTKTAAPAGAAAGVATSAARTFGYDVAKEIAKAMGTAVVVGGGTFAASKLYDHLAGPQRAEDAHQAELGKLKAQASFKARSLMQLKDHHDRSLAHAMKDEIVGKADNKLMHATFNTMKRFAPNLAADENAVTSFLREHAIYGTGPSYAALKNLADAESAVAKAGGV